MRLLALLFASALVAASEPAQQRPLILDMVHHNPGEPRYESRYEDPAVIEKMGFNGKVYFLFDAPTIAINWESVDPDVFPKGSPGRAWVDAKAAQIDAQLASCKAAGIKTYAMADLVLFPKTLVAKYGLEKTYGDPRDPQTDKFLRAMIRQIFERFPDLNGLVVRIGETYLEDAPHHQGHIDKKRDPDATIIPLAKLLREEVCVKRGKQLVFRTWLAFDTDPKTYLKVSDTVEPHPLFIFSVKHCEGDFHRGNAYSRILGQGRHPQLVEVQCAREYEGKGAYPNYIANSVIEGFEEHRNTMPADALKSIRALSEKHADRFAGIWTWTRGGGWFGPFIKNELWCDLNAWVMAQWARDTTQSEESVFNRYATERLGLKGDDVAKFRRLCLLSADAAVRGKNSTHGDISPWWSRDDGINRPQLPKDPEKAKRVLEEKAEAVRQWEEIVKLSREIRFADPTTQDYVKISSEYGLRLYKIYQTVFELTAAENDPEKLRHWLPLYDAAWSDYRSLSTESPQCATLYHEKSAPKGPSGEGIETFIPRLRKIADSRLDAIIARLSPEEKVAQLAGVRLNDLMVDGRLSLERCEQLVPHGIGHVSQFASCVPLRPAELAATVNELQRFLASRNAARLPAIFHEEAISGFAARGATTYPQQIGMASTWRPDLIRANASATARAMRAIGATQALSPMLDVIDDARWGRSEEGFGEDPYLAAVMGTAFIRGLQGDDDDLRTEVAATAKHFAGYGNSSEDLALFRDEVLPPHEAAIFTARVSSVMPGYHRYRGEPASCSSILLRQILRGEWAFDGCVVADYGAIGQIFSQYKITPTPLDGALRALAAGMDVELPSLSAYSELPAALRDGRADPALVDNALRRQLRLKQRLGLLDTDFSVDTPATLDLDPPENQARALEAATQSVILLKNTGVLPLAPSTARRLAVVGPNADSFYPLLGDYTYQMMMEFWWRTPVDATSPRLVTLLSGLRERLAPAGFQIDYARGCDWTAGLDAKITTEGAIDDRLRTGKRFPLEKPPATDLDVALRLATESDVIIAAMGENRYLCGEGVDRKDVRLPGDQEKFIERLAATGKPIVLIVFGGRPMALGAIADHCAAILYAWYPGQAGGLAVTDLLSGTASPSGRLTMTLPRTNAQVPVSYRRGYATDDPPLFPFGHGLTYTTFAYSTLVAPASARTGDDSFAVKFTLTNTGTKPGVEVAQLYLRRPGATGVLARQQLRGFARLALAPGETRPVTIEIPIELLGRSAEDGRLLIEPGPVELLIGASATDIRLRASFDFHGESRTQPRRQRFFSTTRP